MLYTLNKYNVICQLHLNFLSFWKLTNRRSVGQVLRNDWMLGWLSVVWDGSKFLMWGTVVEIGALTMGVCAWMFEVELPEGHTQWLVQQAGMEIWSSGEMSGLEIETSLCCSVPWALEVKSDLLFPCRPFKYLGTAMVFSNCTTPGCLEARHFIPPNTTHLGGSRVEG